MSVGLGVAWRGPYPPRVLPNHSLTFVLLPAVHMPTEEAFRSAWGGVFAARAQPVVEAWGADSASVAIDGVNTLITLLPHPVPDREAEQSAAHSLSAMLNDGFDPAPHVAQLVVVSQSALALNPDRLWAHTRTVAALARAAGAVGVYEGNAQATHAPGFYADMAAGEELPLMLWIGVSLVQAEDRVECLSIGMPQLELRDLLMIGSPASATEVVTATFDVLHYVVSRGRNIPEGETIGRTAAEKCPVTVVPSPLDPEQFVMRVDLRRPKRRWWPFGG